MIKITDKDRLDYLEIKKHDVIYIDDNRIFEIVGKNFQLLSRGETLREAIDNAIIAMQEINKQK